MISHAHASIFWTEGTDGDLSNDRTAPNTFTLSSGANSLIGNVGGSESQDFLTLTINSGFNLSSIVLSSYSSTDGQGFLGVQPTSIFDANLFDTSKYLGYTHFGTSAQNGSLPPADLVGQNLLPLMGDNVNISQGAQGFTPPLGPGTYAFVVQQLGASTAYQFDFGVTPVPEPSSQVVVGLLCGALFFWRRSFARRTSPR